LLIFWYQCLDLLDLVEQSIVSGCMHHCRDLSHSHFEKK
jgi:hypothetical protein